MVDPQLRRVAERLGAHPGHPDQRLVLARVEPAVSERARRPPCRRCSLPGPGVDQDPHGGPWFGEARDHRRRHRPPHAVRCCAGSVMSTFSAQGAANTTAVRPFRGSTSPRRSSSRTSPPDHRARSPRQGERSQTQSQGLPLGDDPGARAPLGDESTIGEGAEAKLNALPQLMTVSDGLVIHFIHVRSKHEDALPLIVTHGWPGSIIEQLKDLIYPLVDPAADGALAALDASPCGDPVDAGHRAFWASRRVPAGAPSDRASVGLSPTQLASAMAGTIRSRAATGVPSSSTGWACRNPLASLAIHTNMLPTVPADEPAAALLAGVARHALWACRRRKDAPYAQLARHVHAGWMTPRNRPVRPQTLYGIADSPCRAGRGSGCSTTRRRRRLSRLGGRLGAGAEHEHHGRSRRRSRPRQHHAVLG